METQHLPFTFISLVLFLSTLFLVFRKWKTSKNNKVIPGPWKLPFIGNLHQIMGDLPYRSLGKLSQKYGPLMQLQLGEIPVIVASSPETAKEILKTQDLRFASRPKLTIGNIVFYNYKDIGLSPYGDYWRNMRKVCILELLSAKMVKSFDFIRQEEMSSLISSIRSTSGSLVNLSNKIFWYANSVTCRSASGKAVHDQDKLILLVRELFLFSGGFDLADLFPSQKWLHNINGMTSKLLKAHKKVDEILEKIINDHRDNRKKGEKYNGESGNEDLVDVLLRVMESGEFGSPITNDNIKAIILDMFAAGTETSSTTIIWAFVELMKNPSVMAKAQVEVREILKGKNNIFDDVDLEELKYLKLVIKETLRLHPPGPLLLPRECREETKIDGYTIPVKTKVLVNAWAIGRDPKYWQNPESFIPERFENNSIDFRGNHFEYLPFGAGRRICPGLIYGLTNVGQPLAQLLYHFDWKLPHGLCSDDIDMMETEGLTAGKKNDLCLIATPYTLS